jgi:proteic killer suppression protein
VIKTFHDRETEKIYARHFSKRLPPNLLQLAWRKLAILNATEQLKDLRVPPGNHLEQLSGSSAGQFSIRINDQWRICFEWREGNAYEVEIMDYH